MKLSRKSRASIIGLLTVCLAGVARADTVIHVVDATGAPIANATVYVDAGPKAKQFFVTGGTDQSGQFQCKLDESVFSYRLTGHDESGRVGGQPIKKTNGSWNTTYQLKLLSLLTEAQPPGGQSPSVPTIAGGCNCPPPGYEYRRYYLNTVRCGVGVSTPLLVLQRIGAQAQPCESIPETGVRVDLQNIPSIGTTNSGMTVVRMPTSD